MWSRTTHSPRSGVDGSHFERLRGKASHAFQQTVHFVGLVIGLSQAKGAVDPPPARAPATESVSWGRDGLREAWAQSRPGLVTVGMLTVLVNLLRIALPLFVFQVLDRVMASRSIDTLAVLAVFTVFAVIVGALAEIVRRWMLVSWGDYIEAVFGRALFVSGLSSEIGSRNRAATAGPSRALADLAALRQFVSGGAVIAWLDVWFAPFFLLVVYLIHPALAGIVFTSMCIMLALGIVNERTTRDARSSAKSAKRASASFIEAAELQPEAVMSRPVAERLAGRWHEEAHARREGNLVVRLSGLAISDTMRLVETLQRIACYAIGAMLAISGSLTIGGVIAGAVLGRIASTPVRRAMSQWRTLSLARMSYHRLKERLSRLDRLRAPLYDRQAPLTLKLSNVTHRYGRRDRAVVKGLSLTAMPGELVAIHGPSGSGKSTLARLSAGLTSPTAGRICLGELDVAHLLRTPDGAPVGYLPQDVGLPEGTIQEIISGFADDRSKRVVEAAKGAGIHDIVMGLPGGYDTVISPQARPLAGGELKRLAIARAIYRRPSLIVLDEPEANLDRRTVRQLIATLDRLKATGSVIVVTSLSKTFLGVADHIVELGRGSRMSSGAPADRALLPAPATQSHD
ncbi:MAG: ATP-binding cassette domain-containing protein [Hyphomicrobiaceae bacterium]|nr:ATP-binding cassette domain-containing protein [Hyphomicrobiaceae bacterium]